MRDFIYRIWGIKEKKYVMTASLYEDAEFMPLNEYFKREKLYHPRIHRPQRHQFKQNF